MGYDQLDSLTQTVQTDKEIKTHVDNIKSTMQPNQISVSHT